MNETAAIIATTILLGLTLFQIALILGAPIGRFAWGGQHKVLPKKLRIASVTSIILYIFFALIALEGAGLINLISNDTVVTVFIWIIFAYLFFGIFLNAISRSKPERYLMTPVAAVLAASFLLIAL